MSEVSQQIHPNVMFKEAEETEERVWSPRVSLQRPLLTSGEDDSYPDPLNSSLVSAGKNKKNSQTVLKDHVIINITKKNILI